MQVEEGRHGNQDRGEGEPFMLGLEGVLCPSKASVLALWGILRDWRVGGLPTHSLKVAVSLNSEELNS